MPPKRAVIEDDDDLDEFDNLIDQFDKKPSSSVAEANKAASQSDKSPLPKTVDDDPGDPDDIPVGDNDPDDVPLSNNTDISNENIDEGKIPTEQEINEQLMKMFSSMNPEGEAPDFDPSNPPDFGKFFEDFVKNDNLMKQLFEAGGEDVNPSTNPNASTSASQTPKETPASNMSFQESIAASMKKVNESRRKADQNAEQASNAQDPLAALMGQLGNLGLDGSDNELAGLFDHFMKEIVSRDLLYEPLKEMAKKYPEYIAQNKDSLSEDDIKRYEAQHSLMLDVIKKFEEPGAELSEDQMTPQEKERRPQRVNEIVGIIEKISDYGQPPEQLMGDFPGGLPGLPNLPGLGKEGDCTIM